MNTLQNIIGSVFPPYKFKLLRKEWTALLDALIDRLPQEYESLKQQRKKNKFSGNQRLGAVPWLQVPNNKLSGNYFARLQKTWE